MECPANRKPKGTASDFVAVIGLLPSPPHIALVGAIGKAKTTTGVQIALERTNRAWRECADPMKTERAAGVETSPLAAGK